MIIRCRRRVQSSPPAGLDQEWFEYQVVFGRSVVGRYGTLEEALDAYPDAVPDDTAKAHGGQA